MDIVVATRNNGKLKEIKEIFKDLPVTLISLNDFSNLPPHQIADGNKSQNVKGKIWCGGLPEVVEDGLTFHDNALKKAKIISEITGYPTLADDSGLEVDVLNGKPGIYSARFAGEDADDNKNIKKLLGLMKEVPLEKRSARFVCLACLIVNKKNYLIKGVCAGRIILTPRGSNGFGYDPVFVPDGFKRTFAELSDNTKNKISHRAKAMREMVRIIKLKRPLTPSL